MDYSIICTYRLVNNLYVACAMHDFQEQCQVHRHELLLAVSETLLFFVQCIIKQLLLDSAFVISRIIKVLVMVISLSFRLRLITFSWILIILNDDTKRDGSCPSVSDGVDPPTFYTLCKHLSVFF